MENVLCLGPYIGSWEHEIISFMPYMKWVFNAANIDNVYLSSHSNRRFLYDFIDDDKFLPVYGQLSRDEFNQSGYINKSISQKDYNIILRKFKNDIIEKEGCSKKSINNYHINYVKSTPPYSVYNKIFEKLPIPDIDVDENKIIFIPDIVESKKVLSTINEHLKSICDFIIIGDMKSYFENENILFSDIDYYDVGYKKLIKYISTAKAVICPISHWTTICNLQKIPVFSWGESVGQHKEDGVYHFNNKKCITFPSYKGIDCNSIINMIEYFLKEVFKNE